jgi:CubicO group peptidase (beta-lactamase class C family)
MKPTRSMIDQSFGKLDAIVKQTMERTGVPGIALAVVFDDQVVYQNGYGFRSTETKERVKAETVFQIASLSKPVSATIMAGLVGGGKWNNFEKGAFAWDDPIAKYASNLVLSDPWVTEHVTFKDLFSHRSGLLGGAGNDLRVDRVRPRHDPAAASVRTHRRIPRQVRLLELRHDARR